MLHPQGNFYPQGVFGPQAFQSNPGYIPFANTPYGYPQQTPAFAQGLPQWSSWQYPGQQQAALQQQPNPEQINPAMTPRHHLLQQLAQYHYSVAQQLAQLAAQQAFQSSVNPYAGQFQGAGQFIPGPLGANFVPGITMH